jgi:CarD family transcriptional regulator
VVHFKVGDIAVYPAHGVGEVTGIESREVSGREHRFYVLRIIESGMRVMVPTDNATSVGLRGVIPKADVKKVFAALKRKKAVASKQTWNRRHREYMEKLKTGSVFDIADVLRELSLLQRNKELSFSERRVLETARSLLVKELAIARRTKESRIERELDAIFT